MDEQQFINEINAIPWEQPAGNEDYRNALLVFADWLEEQGDPRAELIRLREDVLDHAPKKSRSSTNWAAALWGAKKGEQQELMTGQRKQAEERMQRLIHGGLQPIQATWENSLGMRFCWCPPGAFWKASPDKDTQWRWGVPQPPVLVQFAHGFWIGKYQVTQGEWERVMETTPWKRQKQVKVGASYPATFVNWFDAQTYCQKLPQPEVRSWMSLGWECRLPTEDQWEFACRAGTTTKYCFGDDVGQLSAYAWWSNFAGNVAENAEYHAHEVGQLKPNAWGLHDVHGNVSEWCEDWGYGDSSGDRVHRGGSWLSNEVDCQTTNRDGRNQFHGYHDIGFRVAIVPRSK